MTTKQKSYALTDNIITMLAPNIYYISDKVGAKADWVVDSNTITDGWAKQYGLGKPQDVNDHIPKSRYKQKRMGYRLTVDLQSATVEQLKRLCAIKANLFNRITDSTGYLTTANPNLFIDRMGISYYVMA